MSRIVGVNDALCIKLTSLINLAIQGGKGGGAIWHIKAIYPPPLSKHAKSQKNDGQTGSCA